MAPRTKFLTLPMGRTLLSYNLQTGKRGKFSLHLSSWCLWDPVAQRPVGNNPPPLTWLGVLIEHYACPGNVANIYLDFTVTRHALERLAVRCNVRTIDDLMAALLILWRLNMGNQANDKRIWQVPLTIEDAPHIGVAVFERSPNAVAPFVKTVLSPEMVEEPLG